MDRPFYTSDREHARQCVSDFFDFVKFQIQVEDEDAITYNEDDLVAINALNYGDLKRFVLVVQIEKVGVLVFCLGIGVVLLKLLYLVLATGWQGSPIQSHSEERTGVG